LPLADAWLSYAAISFRHAATMIFSIFIITVFAARY
jgi:hypothetical protein